MSENLAELVCGITTGDSEVDSILRHLKGSIDKIVCEINALPTLSDEKLSLYGPFLGRSLIELTATALIAKLDPFRILLVKGNQIQADYAPGKPQKASIRWAGDILAENVAKLWDDKSIERASRAILGDYSTELILKKSAQDLLDTITEETIGDRYQDLTQYDGSGLIARIKGELMTLYSVLSKGIHHEFVVPVTSVLDRDTVITSLNRAIFATTTLALIVSFVPYAYGCPNKNTSIQLYKEIEILEV
jgi:hypothetical protein